MKVLVPWFWEAWQMPEREVWRLTSRGAHAFLTRWAERQRTSQRQG